MKKKQKEPKDTQMKETLNPTASTNFLICNMTIESDTFNF